MQLREIQSYFKNESRGLITMTISWATIIFLVHESPNIDPLSAGITTK